MSVSPNSIVTPQTPKGGCVALSTSANTNYTAPTNTTLVITAGAQGSRVTKLKAIPCATVTATQLQLFRSSDGGTTKRFAESVLMAAYTMAQTTQAPSTDFGPSDSSPMILGPNEQVLIAVGVGSVQINVEYELADY